MVRAVSADSRIFHRGFPGNLGPALPLFLLLIVPLCGLSVTPGASEASCEGEAEIYPHHEVSDPWGPETPVLWLDFGLPHRVTRGTVGVGEVSPMPGVRWGGGLVRVREREPKHGGLLGDLVEGSSAALIIDVDSLECYGVRVVLGDPERARGPVDLLANGTLIASGLTTDAGEFAQVRFPFQSARGRLELQLDTQGCDTFAIAALAVYATPGDSAAAIAQWGARRTRPLHREPEPSQKPLSETGSPAHLPSPTRTLREYCDYLLQQRSSEGCFSYHGNWYEASFSIRTLLAGAQILGEDEYRTAALECLDRFVEEQREDGGWSAQYFGRPGCPEAREMVDNPHSMNLADVGSMALSLVVATDRVSPPRREKYVRAARRYADEFVLPNQLDSGAFPNRYFEGQDFTSPYSVATGIQAAFLAALWGATGEERYQVNAQRAALFLASTIDSTGDVWFHAHNRSRPNSINAGALSELFYIMEGLLWVYHYSSDDLKLGLRHYLEDYACGSAGLLIALRNRSWWRQVSAWETSKKAGILFILETMRSFGLTCIDDVPQRIYKIYVDPDTRPFAILRDPGAEGADFALPATALAGLGVASLIDRRALFPTVGKASK